MAGAFAGTDPSGVWQRIVHALLDRVNCVFVVLGAGGVCQHVVCCDVLTQADNSAGVEDVALFVCCGCKCFVVLLFVW